MRFVTLFLLSSLALMNASCSSCNNDKNLFDAGLVDSSFEEVGMPTTISGNGWQLTLPSSWQNQDFNKPSFELLATNKEDESLFLLYKEEYKNTFDQFAIESIRKLRDEGAVINDTANVTINDQPFVMIESIKGNIRMFSHYTVFNNYAFSLSCGGNENNTQTLIDCKNISQSIRLQ